MADTMEIIISAVDSASEVFQSIIESATSMASGITDAVGSAGSDFDTIADNVANFSDTVSNVDTSTLEEVADQLGMDTEEVERLIQAGADIGSMSAGFNEVAVAADELEQEIQEDIDKMEELGSAGDVMAAQTLMDFANGVSDSMSAMADRAGNVQDSWTRLGLAAEGAGISMDNMKSAVTSLSDETGRAGGSIRESFITMTSAGITDMNTMQEVFKGASAQAFILGTDVNSLADKFSGMAMKSTLSEKTLKGTGITMQELGEAMGLQGATVDEVKDKWGELDVNQRAAALGMAASMNEGKDANDEYKNSWQGLQDQVEIAKGKLETMAGKVLLPVLIPAMKLASDILNGFGSVIDAVMKGPFGGLVSIVGASAGVFMIAFAGVLALKNILGFLKLEASLAKIEMIALAFAEEIQAGGSITSAAANAIGATGFAGLATAAWGAATAVWAAIAPFLPFIAAAALVAIAIYEVGKAFGWWTDVSSMLDAVKAGVTRLWNAFINHPDVQATIKAISDAWNWLSTTIGEVGQAVMDFFGINESGNFDVVRAIIDGIGAAWDALKWRVMLVVDVMQATYNGIITVWTAISGFIMPIIGTIITTVTSLINIFNRFRDGQISLPDAIIGALQILWNGYFTILTQVGQFVSKIATQLIQYGVRMGSQFVNRIISYLKQLPGKAYTQLANVVGRIKTAGANWISTAASYGSQVVTSVINKISELPGKVYNEFTKIGDKINSSVSSAVNAASNFGSDIKNAVLNALSIHSPGIIQKKIAKEFEDTVDRIHDQVDPAYTAGSRFGESIVDGFNSVDFTKDTTFSNIDITTGREFDINTGQYYTVDENREIRVKQEHEFLFDFRNVPSWIDTDKIIELMREAIKDKTLIKELVSNPDFQNLDAEVKERILRRVNRSRGV